MAAMLVKNQDDGKPIPGVLADLRESEKIAFLPRLHNAILKPQHGQR
jgi:hypothetical protein